VDDTGTAAPGTQLSLFDTIAGKRHQVIATFLEPRPVAAADSCW
jgi:hypothetical protein